jgi:aspartate carbamoyltransferase catalytic subunit
LDVRHGTTTHTPALLLSTAYRGVEVEAEVIDGPQSVIIDQAENRLHGQKAIVCMLQNIDLLEFVKRAEAE